MKKVNIISSVITDTSYIYISDTGQQYLINKGDETKQEICNQLNLVLLENKGFVLVDEADLKSSPEPNIFDLFNNFASEMKLEIKNLNSRIDSLNDLNVTVAGTEINVAPIANHIKHAVETKNTVGIENLIKRISNMESQHSVEDLLLFLKHTDLPITDNGDILFYKKVTAVEYSHVPVDNYSRIIPQAEFSVVSMHPDLVDLDRRASCSYGLHVASLKYAVGFGGNRVLIGLVRPEDVIAVPVGEHTKMRVSKYLVLEYLNKDEFEKFNNSIISDSLKSKIAKYISGYIPEPTMEVELLSRTVKSETDLKFKSLIRSEVTEEPVEVKPLKTVAEVSSVEDIIQKLKINKEAHIPASQNINKLKQQQIDKSYVLGMEEEFVEASTLMSEFISKYRDDIKELVSRYGSLSKLVDSRPVEMMEEIFSRQI